MDCRMVEARLSDHLEGTLEPDLLALVEAHLDDCASCRTLRQTLPDVIDALRAAPDVAPSATLAARAAEAALLARRAERAVSWMSLGAPQWLQTAAAGIALVVAGATLLALGPENVAHSTSRFVERSLGSGTTVRARADRVVEDLRVLRVMVGTALEGRLDGVNDRVRDYRKLLQKRRPAPSESASPSPSEVGKDGPRSDVADPGPELALLLPAQPPAQVSELACDRPRKSV